MGGVWGGGGGGGGTCHLPGVSASQPVRPPASASGQSATGHGPNRQTSLGETSAPLRQTLVN